MASETPKSRVKETFIEEMGLLMASFGLPRMSGRVLGALLVADPPEQTAEALAQTLQASRGSISGATKSLEQMGLVDRVGKPGERKDYFRNRPNAWFETTKRRMAGVTTFRQMAEKGLLALQSDDPEVRRGLEEMRDYFAYWEGAFPEVFGRWLEQRDAP